MHPTRQDPQPPCTSPQPARSAGPLALAAALVLALAPSARAGDGVREISHACATQTGCFGGDAAGYPVTIGISGSYRLTNDLVVPDEDTTGIEVGSSDVALDLAGFGIFRSGCRVGGCTLASGSGAGVRTTSSSHSGVSVRNGSVVGMGSYGVDVGRNGEVSGVHVRANALDGIFTGLSSIVSGNTAYQNGARGIAGGAGSTLSGNTAYENGDDGIGAGLGCNLSGNTAYRNGADGITGSTGCNVSDNTAYDNDGDGFDVTNNALVHRNIAVHNDGYGLRLSSGTVYRENVVNSNGQGSVIGGVDLFGNACNGTTTCP